MTPAAPDVAVELERLRGAVDTGFAKLNGRLDVALQRTGTVEADIATLERRLAALERARWPLPSLALLVAVAGVLVTLYQALR